MHLEHRCARIDWKPSSVTRRIGKRSDRICNRTSHYRTALVFRFDMKWMIALLIVLYQVSCSRPFIKDLAPEQMAVTEYRLSLEEKKKHSSCKGESISGPYPLLSVLAPMRSLRCGCVRLLLVSHMTLLWYACMHVTLTRRSVELGSQGPIGFA